MSRYFWLVAALLSLVLTLVARSEDALSLPAGETIALESPAGEIEARLGDLDHPSYAVRQAASSKLESLGYQAVTLLESTAISGSREASSRAWQILKRHFQSGDEDARLAAREALERLSDNRDVSAAQRARDILSPPKPVVTNGRFGPAPAIPAPQVNNAFRGGIIANAGGIRRISISDVNGRKTVEIDERERRIKMETVPAGQIEIEVTDKQNLKNAVRHVTAKDLDDPRRKDGELARLYEQYQPFGRAGQAAAAPPGVAARQMANPAEAARQQLQLIESLLDRYRQRAGREPAAQRMVEALEQTKAQMQAAVPATKR